MEKIVFNDFEQIMSYDVVRDDACIEMKFCVEGNKEYNSCWLGKTLSKERDKSEYWFGLTKDGTQAYEFNTFAEFINAKVFGESCLKEVWDLIYIHSLDGCDVKERLPFYLGLEDGSIRSAAIPLA